ncbi:hypothetical protein L53_13760 [Hyphomonas sp. L-53-1-40]|uniref:hypothetical protein n=1 Tax=Hyphomonas sp. L-53-1-40 TaxID=1207058 RepID=UPI000458B502|nr:hypothetical protein [Hyphomonas sp. L-53-1-40]KCZ61951.1 hypothetical protein L53_13760 [Hyphomonas sp. L-53-1-40]
MSSTRGFRAANRRYKYLFWPLMAVYVAVIIGAKLFIDDEVAPAWLNVAGALAATLPVVGTLYAIRRQTDETDEYTRMNQLLALRDGGMVTASIAFLIGFLQIFNVVGAIDVFWFGALFFFAFGLASLKHCIGRTV